MIKKKPGRVPGFFVRGETAPTEMPPLREQGRWHEVTEAVGAECPAEQLDSYIAGLILLAAAPGTAMDFVWSNLTRGEPHGEDRLPPAGQEPVGERRRWPRNSRS